MKMKSYAKQLSEWVERSNAAGKATREAVKEARKEARKAGPGAEPVVQYTFGFGLVRAVVEATVPVVGAGGQGVLL